MTVELTSYIKIGENEYKPFKDYSSDVVGQDGIIALQLVNFLVIDGRQYQRVWNEMIDGKSAITLEEQGEAVMFGDEMFNITDNVIIEFRPYQSNGNMPLESHVKVNAHIDVLSYLVKDDVEVPGLGKRIVDSFEIDETRHVYVIYFEPTKDDVKRYSK